MSKPEANLKVIFTKGMKNKELEREQNVLVFFCSPSPLK